MRRCAVEKVGYSMADDVLDDENGTGCGCRVMDTRFRFRIARNDVVLSELDDVVKVRCGVRFPCPSVAAEFCG